VELATRRHVQGGRIFGGSLPQLGDGPVDTIHREDRFECPACRLSACLLLGFETYCLLLDCAEFVPDPFERGPLGKQRGLG